MAPVRLCAEERNTKRPTSVSLAMKAVRLVLEARILSVGDVRRGTTLREGVCHTAQQGMLVMLGGRSVCPVLLAVINAKRMEACAPHVAKDGSKHLKNSVCRQKVESANPGCTLAWEHAWHVMTAARPVLDPKTRTAALAILTTSYTYPLV